MITGKNSRNGKENYVQKYEYPYAIKNGKLIIPIECDTLNEQQLIRFKKCFPDVIKPIKINDTKSLRKLLRTISNHIVFDKYLNSECTYLLGMAYLMGIGIEKNFDMAIKLLKKAVLASDQFGIKSAEYDDALKYYNEALKICMLVFGKNHPETATIYNNIAVVCNNKGEYANALTWHILSNYKIKLVYSRLLLINSKSFARQNKLSLESFHRLYFSLSIKYITGDVKMKRIANNRPLLDGMKGHNYGLPDCMKFILECKGWSEKPNFWDIATVTGDTVAQVYNRNISTGCEYCVSGYLAGSEHIKYVFDTLGYSHEYVMAEKLNSERERYIQKIVDAVDRDLPVLVKTNLNDIPEWRSDVGTYCLVVGYNQGGQIVKLLFEGTETVDCILTGENKMDLIFIGEKQREVTLEELYIRAINKMSYWLTLLEQNGKFFGVAAYRAWAEDIEAGRFEDNNLSMWENYGVYVCNLATSGGESTFIFKKLADINQSYSHLKTFGERIQKLLPTESPTGGRSLLWIQLDELDGGMNIDKVKVTMCDKEKRSKVVAVLRDYADRLDKVVELLSHISTFKD